MNGINHYPSFYKIEEGGPTNHYPDWIFHDGFALGMGWWTTISPFVAFIQCHSMSDPTLLLIRWKVSDEKHYFVNCWKTLWDKEKEELLTISELKELALIKAMELLL